MRDRAIPVEMSGEIKGQGTGHRVAKAEECESEELQREVGHQSDDLQKFDQQVGEAPDPDHRHQEREDRQNLLCLSNAYKSPGRRTTCMSSEIDHEAQHHSSCENNPQDKPPSSSARKHCPSKADLLRKKRHTARIDGTVNKLARNRLQFSSLLGGIEMFLRRVQGIVTA
jgi:hypothetical protein